LRWAVKENLYEKSRERKNVWILRATVPDEAVPSDGDRSRFEYVAIDAAIGPLGNQAVCPRNCVGEVSNRHCGKFATKFEPKVSAIPLSKLAGVKF